MNCALCKLTSEDIQESRIVARSVVVCGACKRSLYSIMDGTADPELSDEAKAIAGEMPNLWIAFRQVQLQIDAAQQADRDQKETARLDEIAAAKEAREIREADDQRKAEAAMAEAAAERQRVEEEIAESNALEAEAKAAAKKADDDRIEGLRRSVDEAVVLLVETKAFLAQVIATK